MQPHHGAHFTSQIEVAHFLKNTSTYSTFHRNLLLRKGLPLLLYNVMLKSNLFLFFIGAQFHVKLAKNVGIFLFFGSKNETGCGFMCDTDQIMNPSRFGQENETDGRGEAASRFIFFS